MSPRFIRITVFLVVIAVLLAIVYKVLPKMGTGHPKIDTIGKIVYISNADSVGLPHVFIVSSDGTGTADLTPGQQACADPEFSPDGSQIAYVSDKAGQQQVFIMDADGKEPHAISFGSASKSSPQFSPDGNTLTYLTQGTIIAIDLTSNESQVLLPSPVNATSTATSTLAQAARAPVLQYAWAPGSTTDPSRPEAIAAVQESDDTVDGDIQALTILPTVSDAPKVVAAANSVTFSWHPDGQQVYAAMLGAKTATPTTFSGIVAFSPGGAPTQTQPLAFVKSDTLGPADPEISPNGSQILFTVVNQPDLAHRQIIGLFLQSLVTATPPKQLARGPISGVQWSPDSVKILALLPHPRSSSHDLWVISADGSSPPINITQGSGDITSAAWSPSLPKSAASN